MKLYEKQISQLMKNTKKMITARTILVKSTASVSDHLMHFKHPTESIHFIPKDGALDMMNHLVEMNMIMLEADRSLYLLAREYVKMMKDVSLAFNDRKALLWEVINKTNKTISEGKDNSSLVRSAPIL